MGARWPWCGAALVLASCLDAPPPASTGGITADAAVLADCEPGAELAPVAAVNASANTANACQVDNVLAADGEEAGLDLFGLTQDDCASLSDDTTTFGGCGCVRVDFGAVLPLETVTVRARWSSNGCGYPCAACDDGRVMDVWAGDEVGAYQFLGNVALQGDLLDDYLFAVTADRARYVVVCRDWWGSDRPDVAVDSIRATCARDMPAAR